MKAGGILLAAAFALALVAGCSDGDGRREFASLAELDAAGARIGVEAGTFAERMAAERLPRCRREPFLGIVELYPALEAGKIDAIVYDRPALEYAALSRPAFRLLDENAGMGCISVGVRPGAEALLGKVNEFIRTIRADGTYRDMYGRWVLTRHAKMPDIPEPENPEGEITVGLCLDQEPMTFMAENGPSGYDVEFARRLALFLNRKPTFAVMEYAAVLAAIPLGKYDLGIAQFDATPERRKVMLMSDPYIDTPVGVMVRRADARGKTFLQFVRDGFRGTFLAERRGLRLLAGLGITLWITLWSVFFGTLFAFPVYFALASRSRALRFAGRAWIEAMQGTPILVLLMVVFYGVFVSVAISPILVAVIVFAANFSAYVAEMIKSGVAAVGNGQREAARMLGYGRAAAFCRIVLPQAVLNMLNVYRGQVIALLKDTSVVGYITVIDLTKAGDLIRARTYEAFFPLVTTAVIYFLVAKLMACGFGRLGDRFDPAARRRTGGAR